MARLAGRLAALKRRCPPGRPEAEVARVIIYLPDNGRGKGPSSWMTDRGGVVVYDPAHPPPGARLLPRPAPRCPGGPDAP
jgi:hypothetical protein